MPCKVWSAPGQYRIQENGTTVRRRPLTLLKAILNAYSAQDEVVLDMFAGSGAVAIACAVNKRQFIASDDNEERVRFAQNRLARFRATTGSTAVG